MLTFYFESGFSVGPTMGYRIFGGGYSFRLGWRTGGGGLVCIVGGFLVGSAGFLFWRGGGGRLRAGVSFYGV